ncbi:MAG: hypothetical protein Q4D77_02650 [Peptostreptococcaceae bacterium]|nr:hypothetical protein [Peptostreptococcaceae bacterium]
MKKKKWFLLIIVLVILFFPIYQIYKDGGTKTYTSLTYKIILWNRLDGKRGVEIYFFPHNYHALEYYE